MLPARLGWVLMESPALLLFLAVFFQGAHAASLAPRLMLCLWMLHYLHRTLIFPFRQPPGGRPMPLSVVAMALLFNGVNAWVNARWISHLGGDGEALLTAPLFYAGAGLFFAGFVANVHADSILLKLRARGPGHYAIPQGGLYRWVSCPNYLGELVEWAAWALLTGSLAGLSFFCFSVGNLAPRARSHHRWYKERFPDYPAQRKALLPGLW